MSTSKRSERPDYETVRRRWVHLIVSIPLAALLAGALGLLLWGFLAPSARPTTEAWSPPIEEADEASRPEVVVAASPPPSDAPRRRGPPRRKRVDAEVDSPEDGDADPAPVAQAESAGGGAEATEPPAPPATAEIRGYVVDEHGLGIPRARVVASRGRVEEAQQRTDLGELGELNALLRDGTAIEVLQGALDAQLEQARTEDATGAAEQAVERARVQRFTFAPDFSFSSSGSGDAFRAELPASALEDLEKALVLSGDQWSSQLGHLLEPVAETVTGPDGGFVLTGLAPGSYQLAASAERYVDGRTMATASEGGRDLAEIPLILGASVMGIVRDAVTGQGLAGASVAAVHLETHQRVQVDADELGAFELSGMHPGTWKIGASSSGYVTIEEDGEAAPTLTASPETGVALVDLELRPGGGFSGRVIDERGEPIPGSFVFATLGPAIRQVTADENGFYRVGELVEGEYDVLARSQDFERLTRLGVIVREGVEVDGVDIVLQPAGAIEGRVVTSDGAPVVGVNVSAWQHESGRAQRNATTAEDGSFRIPHLYEGRYAVNAAPGEGFTEAQVLVDVGPSQTVHQDIVVSRTSTVRGVVLGPDGAARPGATVIAILDGAFAATASTDEAGGFELPGLKPADYAIFFRDGWEAMGRVDLRVQPNVDIEGIVLIAREPAVVRGRLFDADGRTPLPGVALLVTDATGQPVRREGQTALDGSFEIGRLYDGSYRIEANVDALRAAGIDWPAEEAGPTVTFEVRNGSAPGNVVIVANPG